MYLRNKLNDKDIQEITKIADNQMTFNMGRRKIVSIMNEKFEEEGKKKE